MSSDEELLTDPVLSHDELVAQQTLSNEKLVAKRELSDEELMVNRVLALTGQKIALLEYVLNTTAAPSTSSHPDQLRRLMARPTLPVGWSLLNTGGLSAFEDRLVDRDREVIKAATATLRSDLVSFFDQLRRVNKVGRVPSAFLFSHDMLNALVPCAVRIRKPNLSKNRISAVKTALVRYRYWL